MILCDCIYCGRIWNPEESYDCPCCTRTPPVASLENCGVCGYPHATTIPTDSPQCQCEFGVAHMLPRMS